MKKLLAALGILAVLLLASYYVVGTRVQPVLQDAHEKAMANSPQLAITIKSATSGLFSSRYVYTLDLTLPPEHGKPGPDRHIVTDVAYDVTHGPIPVGAGSLKPCLALVNTTFTIEPSTDKDVRDFFTRIPELAQTKAITWVNFDSSMDTRVSVPPFDRSITGSKGETTRFAFLGLTGDMHNPATFDQGTGTLASPGLTIEDAEASVTLTSLGMDIESKEIRPGLVTGKFRYKAQALDITPKGRPATALKELIMDMTATPRGSVLDYMVSFSTRFKDFKSGFSPAYVSLALRNLNIDAMERMTADIRARQKAGQPSIDEQQVRDIAKSMLPSDPILSLDVIVLDGDDKQLLHADVKSQGMTELPPMPLMALPMLRGKAIFEGREQSLVDLLCFMASTDKSAQAENCPQNISSVIERFLAQGLVLREGDKLKSEAEWDGRSLTVNGKPMQ